MSTNTTRRGMLGGVAAGTIAATVPLATARASSLETGVHDLIRELRSENPDPALWHWADGYGNAHRFLTWGDHQPMGLLADALEALIGGAS